MSLGAIDFGIIIDGAVIIVEFVSFQMTQKASSFNLLPNSERQDFRDKITIAGASKMMNSAVFGQLIIIIVFIPILALSGVEGKMFKPMALTFSFALLGAMMLCFTYVPVMTSLFVNPSQPSKLSTFATRLNDWLYSLYQPVFYKALAFKKTVLMASFAFLVFSALLFNSMGGEFVPTLDEGDFVIQPVLKTGTSLSKTVEITTQIERVLKEAFPDEVNQIVSRIGAAEVPTDPMSMEESDVIITLHPRGQWTKAGSKDELADKFKEALEVLSIPELEFTQPIEMRFNELITGVRADVAIKVFGEDLDILVHKGEEIKKLIENVEGAADITVEKIEGLPQISVLYNRQKIARYGLNISQVNDLLGMAIAGKTLGTVFEGEKQFDMVVRLDEHHRTDIKDIQHLYIDTPSGAKIPLSELADISYQKGPAKISRDNTKRRMVVGVMVRNRDLQSVVDDIQEILNRELQLPVGYTITYGGQFENLQSAIARLKIAVPVALFLIFVMLYFAFGSVKDALMIYSAIPLAAIGGVLLLWLRDLPFSISAGIGFIALFGVAVLNGIMLIEHFKTLKEEHNFKTMDALVKQGTKDRFRAIMLTASSTALGFLPMAVSVNVGAEVQRPLATVVIGGLITSTLLTLVVLPILYMYFDKWEFRFPRLKSGTKALLLLIGLGSVSVGVAQNSPQNLEALLALASENNQALKSEAYQLERSDVLTGSAFDFEKTTVYYGFDENNIAENGKAIRVFGIQQNFLFPTVYGASKKLLNKQYELKTSQYEVAGKSVKRAVTSAYYNYVTAYNKAEIYKGLDSLYSNFAKNAARRFELGETNYLESITANSKQRQIQIAYQQSLMDIGIWYEELHKLVQTDDSLLVALPLQTQLDLAVLDIEQEPEVAMFKSSLEVMTAENKLEKNKLLPDITLEYFQGTNDLLSGYLYGYQVGLKIPILFGAQSSKIRASKIGMSAMEAGLKDVQFQMNSRRNALEKELLKYREHITYYQNEGEALSEAILKTAESSYKNGEIDFFQYILSVENAFQIELDYIEQLNNYNQTVIQLNYLSI
jgi:cobalt-zinc-cadmium resistance protein CzcA